MGCRDGRVVFTAEEQRLKPCHLPLAAALPLIYTLIAGPSGAQVAPPPAPGPSSSAGTSVDIGTVPVTASPTGPVIGQQPDAEGFKNYVTTGNRTGGKADLPVSSVAQDVVVVPQKVIQDQGATSTMQALENVAGVSKSGYTRIGQYDGFTLIRGFPASSFLRNGYYDENAGITTQLPWIGDAERVEVLKGPSALLYGQSIGGIGGIVNLVTKKPLLDPSYTIGGSVNSFGGWSTGVDLSQPLTADKTWLSRFTGEINDNKTWIDNFQVRQKAADLTVQGLIGPNTSITLITEWVHQENGQYYGLPAYGTVLPAPRASPFQQFSTSYNPNDPRSLESYDGGRLQAIIDHHFNDDWTLRVGFGYDYGNRDNNQYYISPNGNYAISGLWSEQFNHTHFRSQTYSTDTTLGGKFGTGPINHDLVFGLAYLADDTVITNRRGFNAGNSLNPEALWGTSSLPEQVFNHDRQDNGLLTLYANDVVSVTDRLKLSGGVSFVMVNQHQTNQVPVTTPPLSQTQSGIATRAGPIYKVVPNLFLFADFATTFVPNYPVLESNGAIFNKFNPLTGRQFEAGAKYVVPNFATITVAAYQITEQNVQTPDPVDPNITLQSGEQRSRGLELDGAYHLQPGWDLLTAAAYTEAVVTRDNSFLVGSTLADMPRYSGRIFSTYEVQDGRYAGLGVGGGLTVASQRTVDVPTTAAPTVGRMPGYATVDALIYYKAHGTLKGWVASVNFTNLFDERYYESAQNLSRVYPGEPFNALFRVAKTF